MKLQSLLCYNSIIIQCHDNPDPDALASAFGLYLYFMSKEKNTRLVYTGRDEIQKSNIKLMVKELSIPVQYVNNITVFDEDLLITVDCQYGESNVTPIHAKNVAIIDHHQASIKLNSDPALTYIHPELGSCSTLVWKMLKDEEYPIIYNRNLSTALYYGLMTDTSDFTELNHPIDKDMKDELVYDKALITQLNNSKISFDELEIAGVALIKSIYNPEYRYALIHAKPCDPNVLGYIIDLVLQVDVIDACVVFNDKPNGFKYSVRSCVKDVHANELAAYIAEGIGGGGGHIDKAGGFISLSKFESQYNDITIDTYMGMRLDKYFLSSEIIYTKDYNIDISDMKMYQKKSITLGVVDPLDLVESNSDVLIRTLEGDVEIRVTGDFFIMIGILGEIYPIKKDRFKTDYEIVDETYTVQTEYLPSLRCKNSGETIHDLTKYAKSCKATGVIRILAKPVDHIHKIYTMWDDNNYYLGNPGDYIACKMNDHKDVYIIAKEVFDRTYEEIEG